MSGPVDPSPLGEAMAAVWERFRGTMDERVAAVERAALALLEGALDAETRRTAEREAHKLAGAVGTFGFAEGSRLARQAEDLLMGDAPLQPADALRLSELAVALRRELARPLPTIPARPGDQPVASTPSTPATPPSSAGTMLIVEPDAELAGRLEVEAAARGFRVLRRATLTEACGVLSELRPDVAVTDLSVADGDGLVLLDALAAMEPPVPAVVMAQRHGFLDRVEVARRGGRAFLLKPLPVDAVIDAVQHALEHTGLQSSVLAVDDDPAVLEAISGLLAPRGIRLHGVSDAESFWEALEAGEPDVVVLDVDMPRVNGLEICRVLRGDPRWRTLPVLFLTARTDRDSVASVYAAGADDYVSKPILGPELVHRIVNRLERVQLLRHLADSDALTGIANRRRALEQMEQLLRLAQRQEKPFSLAVLDVDHFKQVNDRWGHAMGDEVLRRLAKVLTRHFRLEDVVGRWGGEEFVVGMFGMEKDDGVQRLRALQERLTAERFGGAEEGFSIGISAGIAQMGLDGRTVDALYHAADTALYQAKESGRGRVIPAGWTPDTPDRADRVDVLVVEDDAALARLLVHSLETRGMTTRWISDGLEASRLLLGANPLLRARAVLLDVDLPGMDGHTLLRSLASERVLERTRVIVLTVRVHEAEVVAALESGAFDHVAKPFSIPVLLHRVRRAIRG